MKVLVCGGRDFNDKVGVDEFLSKMHSSGWGPFTLVIHGAARGADSLASSWARKNGIPEKPFNAQWKKYGRSAGPIRNQEMLKEEPDLVIAFPGGRGTEDMIKKSAQKGITIIRFIKEK